MTDLLEEFLARCGVHDVRHSGRTLSEHLRGTEQLLRNWGQDEAVCRAGLFHSIYGTNAFVHESATLTQRVSIAALLGVRAEQLVYLFHVLHRPHALIRAIGQGGAASRLDGQFMAINERQLLDLITIECANLLEQGSGPAFFTALIEELAINGLALDTAAAHAISLD